jgi:serine protease Do
MKRTKLLPVLVVVGALMLSACAGLGMSTAAPAAAAPAGTTNQAAPTAPAASVAPAAGAPLAANQQGTADAASLQAEYEAIYQQVNPSVVTIEIGSRLTSASPVNPFIQPGNGQGSQGKQGQIVPSAEGSGFIWDTAGHIVTNNHVVANAAKITVTFSDGSSYNANVVGTDPNTDLAVIQVVGAPASLLKPITVGDSSQVNVGELVVAIGNPFGLANTMTTGIVSAIGRSIQAGAGNSQNGQSTGPSFSIPDVIQTDAAINPGNSGGVLVDMTGALVGVPSQIESPGGGNSGIGFAIPSAIVKQVAPQLISSGKAQHSYLGISGTTITPDVISALNLQPEQQGVLVVTVVNGGPADKAGMMPATVDANGNPTAAGDIITGVQGQPITRFEDLVSYLYSNTQPGQTVTLDVLRGGKTIQLQVTLGVQPTS